MERLAVLLALHGAAVLTVSLVAGLLLYRTALQGRDGAAWHLAHSGGSGRGILLFALAATIHWLALPPWQVSNLVWLVLFFTWTSMLAMIIAAASGERGLRFDGSTTNKIVYVLYVVGTIAIFPACALLAYGFFEAL